MDNKLRSLVTHLSTTTVSEVQAESISNKDMYNALMAIRGSWGSLKAQDMEIAYYGKVCTWRKLGSGKMTFPIPVNPDTRYFATYTSATEAYGILIDRTLSQLTIDKRDGELWQVTGTFIINTRN